MKLMALSSMATGNTKVQMQDQCGTCSYLIVQYTSSYLFDMTKLHTL